MFLTDGPFYSHPQNGERWRDYGSDPIWQAALDAGWGRDELAEVFAILAANLFTNYFNQYAGTKLDVAAAPPLVE